MLPCGDRQALRSSHHASEGGRAHGGDRRPCQRLWQLGTKGRHDDLGGARPSPDDGGSDNNYYSPYYHHGGGDHYDHHHDHDQTADYDDDLGGNFARTDIVAGGIRHRGRLVGGQPEVGARRR